MASAAPARRANAYPDLAPRRTRRAALRVMPGSGKRVSKDDNNNALTLVTVAKLAAVLLIVLAVASCLRIALMSATVSTLIESDTLSSEISQARSTGTSLEMEQSVLTSPPALNAAAKKLHMTTPWESDVIDLGMDVVAVDAAGNLSLTGTVKNVIISQE